MYLRYIYTFNILRGKSSDELELKVKNGPAVSGVKLLSSFIYISFNSIGFIVERT